MGECRGLMVRESDLQSKGCGFESQVRQGLKVGIVNEQHFLHLQYHDWGALEQGTEPPTAPGCWSNGCPLLCVCAHLDGLNAEKVSILDNTSHIYIFFK